MFSFITFIIAILWILYRRRVALNRLNAWAEENSYKIEKKNQQWFVWGSRKNNIIGMQVVFLVDVIEGTDKWTCYVVMGHWLWGLLEKEIYVDKSLI